jgi:hypothetical protein
LFTQPLKPPDGCDSAPVIAVEVLDIFPQGTIYIADSNLFIIDDSSGIIEAAGF